MPTNFHTHTKRCRHAWGEDEDYVREAIKNGYTIFGFADHACWPIKPKNMYTQHAEKNPGKFGTMQDYVFWIYDSHESYMRMGAHEFGDYAASIKHLRSKYSQWIDIRLGLEAEYDEKFMDWMLDLCIKYKVDYLILGHHMIGGVENGVSSGSLKKEQVQEYVDSAIKALETGMYAYMAHPDIFMKSPYLTVDEDIEDYFRQIARACKRLNIPVEYNCAGLQANLCTGIERYPHHRFWEIAAEEGCKAVIGMDAHLPEYVDVKYYNMARETLEGLGMDIVEDIGRIDYKKIKAENRLAAS